MPRKLWVLLCISNAIFCNAAGAVAENSSNQPTTSSLYTVLHSFDGADGAQPYSGLLLASDGRFYGTAVSGNAFGTIYSMDTSGNFTLLYSFPGGSGGAAPHGGLLQASDGSFYGTTTMGGSFNFGTIYRMIPGESPTVIHSFNSPSDGELPDGNLIQGTDGFLYGTTSGGGPSGGGTVFRMATDGTKFSLIHAFPSSSTDGANPLAGLLQAANGLFYGTTAAGGTSNQGTMYNVSSTGKVTILHDFTGGSDGGTPKSPLTQLGQDNFWGTTTTGGAAGGTLFKMDYVGVFTIRHTFKVNVEGGACISGVFIGGNGSLYGVTSMGSSGGFGSIFAIDSNFEVLTVIQPFGSSSNGFDAIGQPVQFSDGSLYGTAQMGGANNDGVIYRVVPGSVPTSWSPVGPNAISVPNSTLTASGKLQALVVEYANSQVMYAGGGLGPGNAGPYSQAGIYSTVNGGTTWTQADSGLADTVVNALWLDQSNPGTLLAGTNTTGIFQSTNGGKSWTRTAGAGATTAFVQVGTTLYAATALGIGKSTNNGTTWTIYKSTSSPVLSLAASGSALYAGLTNGQVMVQQTPGGPWTTTTPAAGAVLSLAVNPTNSANAFAVEWNNYLPFDLYVTANSGASWAEVTGLSCPVQAVAYSSISSTLYAGCDGSLYQSVNNGNSWTQIAGAIWDVRLIEPDFAGVAGNIGIGSEQGLFLGTNQGANWQSLNGDVTPSIDLGLAVEGNFVLAAAEDLGPLAGRHTGQIWNALNSSYPPNIGSVVIYNPGSLQYAYFFSPVSGLQYSNDDGKLPYQNATGLPGSEFPNYSGNGQLLSGDVQTPANVYAAGVDGVFKSTDFGVDWSLMSWPIQAPVMIGVDPTDSQTIFVGEFGQGNGSLQVTHDGGQTWTTSTPNGCVSCGSPISIAVDPNNPQIVLIGMSQPPPGGGIFVSTDRGANFTHSNSGITASTSLCATAAVPQLNFDPSGASIVAAATNSGLYLSYNLGASWTNIRANAVPTIFTGVVWASGDLWASTCGEGVVHTVFPQ